ncbi:MAG: alkaline phosphatase [Bacteroidetes bacterium]|nr:alkaline phosphatase [Bacteroidota bacterium]
MLEFFKQLTDPQSIIQYGGLALLLFVVFAETGLLIGFFLPGDNLIFLSGIICVLKPELLGVNLLELITLLCLAAILGNCVGYAFGYKVGPAMFEKKDSLIFRKRHLELTKAYYEKNGGKTLIFGRFVPIIRTFAPIFAGIVKVDFRMFMVYNIVGAIAWIGTLGSLGYYLGTYTWVQENLRLIFISLIIITLIPLVIPYLKRKK